MTDQPKHEEGCHTAHRTPVRARRFGCQCPQVGEYVRAHQRALYRSAKAGGAPVRPARPDDDVDEWDVDAAIVYAGRGVPVPATLTTAERHLVADWLDRYRPDSRQIDVRLITGLSERVVAQRWQQRQRVSA